MHRNTHVAGPVQIEPALQVDLCDREGCLHLRTFGESAIDTGAASDSERVDPLESENEQSSKVGSSIRTHHVGLAVDRA